VVLSGWGVHILSALDDSDEGNHGLVCNDLLCLLAFSVGAECCL
jgi:hypothetical protein